MQNKDKLQDFNVPKYIKIISVIYIASCLAAGFLTLVTDILEKGNVSMEQFWYVINVFGKILIGFIFWGTGQVFSKFMEKNK